MDAAAERTGQWSISRGILAHAPGLGHQRQCKGILVAYGTTFSNLRNDWEKDLLRFTPKSYSVPCAAFLERGDARGKDVIEQVPLPPFDLNFNIWL